jgi:hypothetical protein
MFTGVIWNEINGTNDSFVDLINRWDAGWYHGIVENGYMKEPSGHEKGDAANWAFFPLFPLSVRFFSIIASLSTAVSGVLLSTIFLFVATVFLIKYMTLTRTYSVGMFTAILLNFGPYSFYFSSTYTESLFVMLIAITLYCCHKQKWLSAGVAGALLSATRPTGVLIFFTVAIFMIGRVRTGEKKWKDSFKEFIQNEKMILSLLLVPLGLFVYMFYLYFLTGDIFAFKHIELAWGRENGNPLVHLFNSFRGSGSSYLGIWAILGLLAALYLALKKRFEEAIFVFLCLAIPLMSSMQSIPRYVWGSLMFVIALGDWASRHDVRKWMVIALAASLNIGLLFLWFAGHNLVT